MIHYLLDGYFRLRKSIGKISIRIKLVYSRAAGHRYRRQYLRRGGETIIDRKVKKEIKAYCRERFGSAAYWPHLAYFTEMRGEFIKGWIPHDYFTLVLEPRLNPAAYHNLGDMRTRDHRRFGDFAIEPLFLFISGNFYSPEYKLVEKGEVQEFMARYDDTIVQKQEFGFGGKQVEVMHSSRFNPELLNKRINYIIQPYIKQYPLLSELYPHSVNTFRVITFLRKDGKVELKYAMLRFGVNGIKVDNLSSGGQCLYFEPDGKPSKTGYDTYGHQVGERHINTGYRFADLKIPMFHELTEKCRTAHEQFPYIRLIGWDVCINESGEPKLIEWNTHRPSFTWEDALFGPFLADDQELE